MQCDQDALCYCSVTYLTEQHRQPFRNSSHSSYKLPASPTATLFSKALPKNRHMTSQVSKQTWSQCFKYFSPGLS